MVRRRKSYQRFAQGGAVHAEPFVASIDVQRDSGDENDSASDDPSIAFQGQIDALRRAEAQTAKSVYGAGSQVHDPQQPQLTPKQQAFIDANPEMLNEPERLGKAILQAHTQGFEPDSDAFHEAVGHNWRAHHVTVAAEITADRHHPPGTPEHQAEVHHHVDKMLEDLNDDGPAPKPKRVAKSSAVDDDTGRGRIVSAPVSRGDSGGGSYGAGADRGRITLSPEQKEASRIAGITEVEYAKQLLRLREEKLNGNYTGRP